MIWETVQNGHKFNNEIRRILMRYLIKIVNGHDTFMCCDFSHTHEVSADKVIFAFQALFILYIFVLASI